MNHTGIGHGRPGPRRTGRGLPTAGLLLAVGLTAAGCGDDEVAGKAPEGWAELTTASVTVAHPAAFRAQGDAERDRHNAAAARMAQDGRTTGTLTVQLDFTDADSAEEAAIGAEAGIALGSRLRKQSDVRVKGPEQVRDAKRVDFDFTSGGEDDSPPRGTRVSGVIVTGLDSHHRTYAVRVDTAEGALPDADLDRIVESITVR
ncbi:hypothetical protein [Streptomyces sp. NRRL WC-3549]|uniref:hypothetical protein n=1 Tax=Streptomyces sp. NRRL WC-3549 TaxID=1463925 RepID=UPI0004CC2E78|nr:hypothetical protein [Streptomyces sp. NRRL WC-3549]